MRKKRTGIRRLKLHEVVLVVFLLMFGAIVLWILGGGLFPIDDRGSPRLRAHANARQIVNFLHHLEADHANQSLAEIVRLADGRPAETAVDRYRALVRLGLDPKLIVHRGDTRQPWQGDTSPDIDPPITAENISFALINHESPFWQQATADSYHLTPILADRNISHDEDEPLSVWSPRPPWVGIIAFANGYATFHLEEATLDFVNGKNSVPLENFHLFSGRHDNGRAPELRMINP